MVVTTLFTGLGNPGDEYRNSRHNTGFYMIDRFAERYGPLHITRVSGGLFAEKRIAGNLVGFLKPLSFMNCSGEPLARLAHRDHISPEKILVIYDDVDLPLGTIKIRQGGSDGGHNGLKSIILNLNSNSFYRLRVGVGPRNPEIPLKEFILSPFSDEDIQILDDVSKKVVDIMLSCCRKGIPWTQTHYKKLLMKDTENER